MYLMYYTDEKGDRVYTLKVHAAQMHPDGCCRLRSNDMAL
jgi:hypothetical protein